MTKGEQVIKIRLHGGEGLGGEDSSALISTVSCQLGKDQGENPAGGGHSFQFRTKHGIASLRHTPAQTVSSHQKENTITNAGPETCPVFPPPSLLLPLLRSLAVSFSVLLSI